MIRHSSTTRFIVHVDQLSHRRTTHLIKLMLTLPQQVTYFVLLSTRGDVIAKADHTEQIVYADIGKCNTDELPICP